MKKYNILFAVAHPDDESLWVGGLLNFLNKREEVNVSVLCATGKNHPERAKEFEDVMNLVGIENWYMGEEDVPSRGGIFLSDLNESFNKGVHSLGLGLLNIDVLITHSFYGDEHLHCQHAQMFGALFNFCQSSNIPFGFFSNLVIQYYNMSPNLSYMKRDYNTHLINHSTLTPRKDITPANYSSICPKHFFQFKVDSEVKGKMLSTYQSINQEEHRTGYASWDSDVEGLYLMDDKAAAPFTDIYSNMNVPAGNSICEGVKS